MFGADIAVRATMNRFVINLVEILFTKHMWIFNLITLSTVAYFLAIGVGELAAEQLRESLPVEKYSPPRPQMPRPLREQWPSKPLSGRAILARNIFDSTVGPIDPDAPADIPVEEFDDETAELLPCDDQNLKLLATVVSDSNAQWSFASLAQGRETHLHRIGAHIGDRTVADITWQYVFFEEEDGYCYLDLFSDTNLDKLKAKRGRGIPRSGVSSRLKKGVKVIGKNKRLVKRRLVKEVMADPKRFTQNVRFRPRKQNGKLIGYQVRRMHRDSPLSLLGLKKRDVIKKINGIPLTNMDNVFKAYHGLGSAENIRLAINRRGKPMELEVRIQ